MKKLFKSISLITLTLILTLGLFGCGKKPVSNENSNINQNQNVNVATSTNATSTAEIDVSNWKTYKNEEYGFEFKYPSLWPDLNDNIVDTENKSFTLHLIDVSHLDHIYLNYDNLSLDKQFEKISCNNFKFNTIKCEERLSKHNLKYTFLVEETTGGPSYTALVATGKYILSFSFQDEKNFNNRSSEYLGLLGSLNLVK